MATVEYDGQLTYVDVENNLHILNPITKAELVVGLADLLAGKVDLDLENVEDEIFLAKIRANYDSLVNQWLDEKANKDLSNVDDDEFKAKVGEVLATKTIEYITTSQTWTVPVGVTEVEIFLVNGGYDGEGSSVTSTSVDSGGRGGAGGACCWIPSYAVTAGQTVDVVVGAANGGVSFFNGITYHDTHITTDSVQSLYKDVPQGVAGGSGTWQNQVTIDGSNYYRFDGYPGQLGYVNNSFLKMPCPIDGKYYGVSGASGGRFAKAEGASQLLQSEDVGAGGIAGKDNADFCPAGGFGALAKANYSSTAYWAGGGGGASFDNNGANGGEPQARSSSNSTRVPVGGNGGDATTYGCGGGGAGAGGGTGGAGAQGVVIIAY